MKKFSIFFAAFLLMASVGMAQAALEWEDPAFCVAGQWLVVNAAHPSAVTIAVPEGTAYGDQMAGGCNTSAPVPAVFPLTVVTERGHSGKMTVFVDSAGASSSLFVSYGGKTVVDSKAHGVMMFKFEIDD